MASRKYDKTNKNKMLVEGKGELLVLPYLIESNGIQWEPGGNPVVYIDDRVGYTNIVKAGSISTELKADGIEALGILLDADEDPINKWISIRNACRNSGLISNMPEDLPLEGLIIDANNGVRVGIWIMPDNKLPGMLETFLGYLLPTDTSSLWNLVANTVDKAKVEGAPFKEAHREKAKIYNWLAWQDPPGLSLHLAVQKRILDPQHPEAQMFVNWFRELYQL